MKPVSIAEDVNITGSDAVVVHLRVPVGGFLSRVIAKRISGSGTMQIQFYETESAANLDTQSEDDDTDLDPELFQVLSAALSHASQISHYVTSPSPGVPYASKQGLWARITPGGGGTHKIALSVLVIDDVQ